MKNTQIVFVFLFSLLLVSCISNQVDITSGQATVDENLLFTLPVEPISYFNRVKPVLERRCVVCHGCYDAPCQLKMSSIEGIQRGANKEKVYDGSRIFGMEPTRLMIDAKTTAQWREKGFYPVLNEGENTPRQNLEQSVLYNMLRLKEVYPQARVGMLSSDFDLELNRDQSCPERDEFQDYRKEHPLGGMPYAMPNLSNKEYKTLVQWLAQGSPVDAAPTPAEREVKQIKQWERFFNGESNKEKLLGRYLFEHLFQAHIHFVDAPSREFYRLVRSTTPPGQVIDEIATVRPYDDPGVSPFYYRLRPYHASIVEKDHVVYELSPQKMARYQDLFLKSDYEVKNLPSYDPSISSNPFKVYEAIPPNLRYRFLLDDAKFFIEGFIKGPVCRGQIALNVIEDQFWVFFSNPDNYLKTSDAEFLKNFSNDLDIPSELGNTLDIVAAWTQYREKLEFYWKAKKNDFVDLSTKIQIDLDQVIQLSIWNGGGTNPNAGLTIYRHLDSASVNFGLTGGYPETAWVIDYPLLERIHYLLVAGFNVYGNVGHQFNTRLYMDFLRMEGEDNFLGYLPVSQRKAIRDSWYVGMRDGLEKEEDDSSGWLEKDVVIGYQTDDTQTELYQHLERRLGKMAGPEDLLNRCPLPSCYASVELTPEQQADKAMAKIADIHGPLLQVFPDLTFVRIRNGNEKQGFAYTLMLNKSYKSISSMFEDERDDRRDVEHDTLTIMKGLYGSYPNFFFDVDVKQAEYFATRYAAIRHREDYEKFVELFGVRRTHPDFWVISDWFQDYNTKQQPIVSGLFDLNRYHNR